MGKVIRQYPQTTTFLKRKESRSGLEPRSFRLPAERLNARPNRFTNDMFILYGLYQRGRLMALIAWIYYSSVVACDDKVCIS